MFQRPCTHICDATSVIKHETSPSILQTSITFSWVLSRKGFWGSFHAHSCERLRPADTVWFCFVSYLYRPLEQGGDPCSVRVRYSYKNAYRYA